MNTWEQNIYFILVEPREPGNIGASARAIKNMGFRNLCLVKPPSEMSEEGKWFARNAHDVLDSAKIYDSVEEAIGDKAVIVGTTRRAGKRRGVILPVEQGTARVRDAAIHNKVAILFGREAEGLHSKELDQCGFLLKIRSSRIQPSLNLSHAVLIIAYELSKHGRGADTASGSILELPRHRQAADHRQAARCCCDDRLPGQRSSTGFAEKLAEWQQFAEFS